MEILISDSGRPSTNSYRLSAVRFVLGQIVFEKICLKSDVTFRRCFCLSRPNDLALPDSVWWLVYVFTLRFHCEFWRLEYGFEIGAFSSSLRIWKSRLGASQFVNDITVWSGGIDFLVFCWYLSTNSGRFKSYTCFAKPETAIKRARPLVASQTGNVVTIWSGCIDFLSVISRKCLRYRTV